MLEENVHKAIDWVSERLRGVWMSQVRKSWIWMIDETRTLVGCTDEETRERRYKNRYMWGIRANSVSLAWFIDEFGKMFAVEHNCMTNGLKGAARLVERLRKGSVADNMVRIERRLEVFRRYDYAGCGELLTNALKYAASDETSS